MSLFLKIAGIIILVIIVLISALLLFIKYKTTHTKDNKNLGSLIDKKTEKFIQENKINGLVIGIVKNGKTTFKSYGTTEEGMNILPDSNTVFELASTSKLFTTSTLQLMIDSGELKTNDKIQSILSGIVTLPDNAQNTTLQHLATHLSGFPSLPNSFLAKMTDTTNPYKDLLLSDLYEYLKTCEGKQADGTFEYSNFGMGLLGQLLALKAGQDYEQLIKNRLLIPLAMNNTFVTIDSRNIQSIIQGYDENGQKAPVWTDHVLTGAGSFLSNAADMVKFIKANLDEKNAPISPSLLKTHLPQLDGTTGLGWILADKYDKFLGNKNIIWHNGMAGGYSSHLVVDKSNNYGFIILSNKPADLSKLAMDLMNGIRTQSWAE